MRCNNITDKALYLQLNSVDNSVTSQKSIGEYLNADSTESGINIIKGSNANVVMENSNTNSIVPGFAVQKINIEIPGKDTFTVNLYSAKNVDLEKIDKFTTKLAKVIADLPPEYLEDLKQECKHIMLTNNIVYNKDAIALAIGPLNQIFLSASKMENLSEQECAEVLIHETGHLVDQTNCSLTGKATKWYKKDFEELKKLISNDLGFDTKIHSLDSVSEFFADYYLNTTYEVSEKHRSFKLFKLLNEYQNDVNNLSREELEKKYGAKTDSIVELSTKWQTIKKYFDYFLNNVHSGEIDRANENAKPMNYEQIDEHNAEASQ